MTDQQRRAADPEASIWVSASAGTGKTRVLTNRVLNLLLAGTRPERILCLTFTKAGAAEMAARIAKQLGDWATMSDDDLAADIAAIAGAPPDADGLGRARQLFAAVLDVPGGMKIQTLHAFSQAVLKRFPLEAKLAPHFTVMEERDAQELLGEARRRLFERARRAPDGALAAAIDHLSGWVGERDFAQLMSDIAKDRSRLRRARDAAGGLDGLIDRVRESLDVDPAEDMAALRGAAARDGAFNADGLRRAATAMIEAGGKIDEDHGRVIADWLAADPERRAEDIPLYLTAFFKDKGKGDLYKNLIHKAALKADPAGAGVLTAEAERLERVRERRRAHVVARATEAVLRIAGTLLGIYEADKTARALVDYDDLILRCRDLLRDGSAAWVLFKLDGGIDHILIDEAQDTNPEQWQVVAAIAEEFFVGEGARDTARTIFAVGDRKQSIFSFQRAAPEMFDEMRRHFAKRVKAAERRWREVPLAVSFRSTAAVLRLVDAVFASAPARDGVVPPEETLHHEVHRRGEAGLVELWPVARPEGEADKGKDDGRWTLPIQPRDLVRPRDRLAARIALTVSGWIANDDPLESAGRPIRYGDIMVLVPRRGPFVDALVRAFKERGVSVAGVDRMVLTDQIAVMDLLALGRFVLLPEDDLSLAEVLKSPLIGLSEDHLMTLAAGRPGSLWHALLDRRRENPDFEDAAALLTALMARADFVRPYEFYADLLGPRRGRCKLLARLGREADDPIDEFLALTLAYERVHVPSLQGFLNWVAAGKGEIKRDLEQGVRNEVRVMTVHGAKGLQAPIVFLPDTVQAPSAGGNRSKPLLWPAAGEAPLWPPRKEHEEAVCARARAALAERRARERRRLLYVALTRASERLYVCGWLDKGEVPEESWYGMVAAAFAGLDGVQPVDDMLAHDVGGWPGHGYRLVAPQTAPVEARPAAASPDEPDVPLWLRAPAPPEPMPPRPLAPSRPAADEPAVRSPLLGADGRPDDGARFRRGLLIHRLLEALPGLPAAVRVARCRDYLAGAARELDAAAREEIAEAVLAVLDAPALAACFGPESRPEVPLSGVVNGRVVSGQVDRLVVGDSGVTILDFKSNRPAPARLEDVPTAYLRQMAAYRALVRGLYPDRPVSCALLWTDGPRLMPLDDARLDAHAP